MEAVKFGNLHPVPLPHCRNTIAVIRKYNWIITFFGFHFESDMFQRESQTSMNKYSMESVVP